MFWLRIPDMVATNMAADGLTSLQKRLSTVCRVYTY